MMTANKALRRAFVLNLRAYIEKAYTEELTNPQSASFAELHTSFFARTLATTADDTRTATILQCALVLWATLHEERPHAFFVPPTVSLDAPRLTASSRAPTYDEACVDRVAFAIWQTKFVKPIWDDFFVNSRLYTLPSVVIACLTLYDALLPGDPARRTGHPPLALPIEKNKNRRA